MNLEHFAVLNHTSPASPPINEREDINIQDDDDEDEVCVMGDVALLNKIP